MSNNDFKKERWELIKKSEREKLGQGIVDRFDKCGCCFVVVDDEQGVWMCNNNNQRPCLCVLCATTQHTHHVLHLPRSSPHPTTTRTNANQCVTTQHTPPAPFAVLCPVCQHNHTSMLLCRPVCPTLAHAATPCVSNHCHHTTQHTRCLCILIPRRSFLVCVQHTPPLQHPTLRCHCPINQCAATSLHSPSTQTTHHAMCCLPLPMKHPHKPHPTHRGCSLLLWSCTTQFLCAAVPLCITLWFALLPFAA